MRYTMRNVARRAATDDCELVAEFAANSSRVVEEGTR